MERACGNGPWKSKMKKLETKMEVEMEMQPLRCCSPSKINLLFLAVPELYLVPVYDCLLC